MQVRTISVKDMLPFQRPREKFVALGPKQMAMEELQVAKLRHMTLTARVRKKLMNLHTKQRQICQHFTAMKAPQSLLHIAC